MESGVLDKGDMQKMQGRGSSRTGLGSTALNECHSKVFFFLCTLLFSKDLFH